MKSIQPVCLPPFLLLVFALMTQNVISVKIGISKTTQSLQNSSDGATPTTPTTTVTSILNANDSNALNLTTSTTTITPNILKIPLNNETTTMSSITTMPIGTLANSTQSILNTTIASTAMTTITPTTVSTEVETAQKKKKKKRRSHTDDKPTYYCPCDLKINSCDINCCCDVDCITANLLHTLNCRKNYWSIYDNEQINGLQACSEANGLSFLCVVDHKQRRKSRQNIKIFDINLENKIKYRWPQKFNGLPQKDIASYYVSGDDIVVWNESEEENQQFKIPYSLTGGNCQVHIPIKHLTNTVSKCTQTIEGLQLFQSEFEDKLKEIKIVRTPQSLTTDAVIMADHCKMPANRNESQNCLDVQVHYCSGPISKSNCKPSTNLTGDAPIANEISIKFMHNFTHIVNCSVFFVAADTAMLENNADAPLLQVFSIQFIDVNETFYRSKTQKVSGNLGYVWHKPIIIAKYVAGGEQTVTKNDEQLELVLDYFNENSTEHYNDEYLFKIPYIRDNNECFIDNHTYETINFGENSIIKCTMRLIDWNKINATNTTAGSAERNFTRTCVHFQQQIFHRILYNLHRTNTNTTTYDDFNVQISQLGNPKNESKLWLKLESINGQTADLAQIVAVYDKKTNDNEFTCRNIVLNVRYEFYYAVVMLGGRANQAMIKKATAEFGPRLDLKFKLDEELKVPVYIDVMFHDLTGISSGQARIGANYLVLLIGCLIMMSQSLISKYVSNKY